MGPRRLRANWASFVLSPAARVLLVSSLGLAACSPKNGPAANSPGASTSQPAPVLTDAEFPATAHHVLLAVDREDPTKLNTAGVVSYQLARAHSLFEAGYADAAEATAAGALFLLRHDDAIASALAGHDETLLAMADAAARRGNAGRARALYGLTKSTTQKADLRRVIDDHLDALERFTKATASESRVLFAGDTARERLAAACVDPSAEAYHAAQKAIVEWMDVALQSQIGEGGPASREERDDAVEAYGAVRTGAPSLIALGLRQGDPLSAATVLDNADLSRALPPGVRLRLEAAGGNGSSEAYLDLFRLFDGARHEADVETSLPPHVADGATLWSTIGLYRSSPGRLEHAMPLAMTLVEFGMPEVASTLLAQNLDKRVSAEAIGWSLALVLRGLLELSQTGQTAAAERSVQEAGPLLAMAEDSRFAAVRPEPARVYALLASIEIHASRLDRALPLLERAVAQTPMADALVRLATLERQKGDASRALGTLERAVSVAQGAGELLIEAHAEELRFQIQRELGQLEDARQSLARALDRTLVAQAQQPAVAPPAAVERLLARILENYGDVQGARRAYERALAAGHQNPIETEVTLTDMARGALTTGDVRLARSATRSALDSGMKPKDLIYVALWQKMTEERAGAASDGLPSQIFTGATDATGWNAQLQRFALGQLDGAELEKVAKTLSERTEAEFYRALRGKPAGALDATSTESLKRVAASEALDLVEVRIARDLLAPRATFTLPKGVRVP